MNTSFARAIAGIALLALIVGCGAETASKTPSVRQSLRPILDAEQLTLYSIYPTERRPESEWPKTAESFHGYPVLKKVDVSDGSARAAIAEALEDGISNEKYGMRCFEPRHAVRAERDGQSVDYLICFECSWIYIYEKEAVLTELVVTEKPRQLLDGYLERAEEATGQ